MSSSKIDICAGFNLFLEHILPYTATVEKGRMPSAPLLNLGGGAWNILKSLSEIDPALKLHLLAFSAQNDVREGTLKKLLQKHAIPVTLLSCKPRLMSSYYLAPVAGPLWSFGDNGGTINNLDALEPKINAFAKRTAIRIVAEISSEAKEVRAAKALFKKENAEQINVLIPSLDLLKNKKLGGLHPDILVVNQAEAQALFQKEPTQQDVLVFSVPTILVTRGSGPAWLKHAGHIYTLQPKASKAPYTNGAGDAATAGLLYALVYKEKKPQEALAFALEIARKTLLIPTPYYVKR